MNLSNAVNPVAIPRRRVLNVAKVLETLTRLSLKLTTEDKKVNASAISKSSADDKVATLRNYRRFKGLCFKCVMKNGDPTTNVLLQYLCMLWKNCGHVFMKVQNLLFVQLIMTVTLMRISWQFYFRLSMALKMYIRLRGHIQGKQSFMLIDSRSTHSFVNEQFIAHLGPGQFCLNLSEFK